MQGWYKVLVVVAGLALLAVVAPFLDPNRAPELPAEEAPPAPHGPSGAPAAVEKSLGPEGAPVVLKVYYEPANECHQPGVEVAKSLAAKFPHQLRVEFVNTGTPEGAAECKQRVGCDVAGMTVNGKSSFKIKENGRERSVQFYGACEQGPQYGQAEVEKVIRQEMARAGSAGRGKTASGGQSKTQTPGPTTSKTAGGRPDREKNGPSTRSG